MGEKPIVVWHRRDLRTQDNRALSEASKTTKEVWPIFIIDPVFFREDRETCDDRIIFMLECLEDLDRQYRELGSSLTILFGESLEKISEIKERFGCYVYFNNDTNMRFGLERDRKAKAMPKVRDFDNDAIDRSSENTRDSWSERCKSYFESDMYEAPEVLNENPIKSEISLNEVKERYSIVKEKSEVPKGGTNEARKRLYEFLSVIDDYVKSISKPMKAEIGTSRLSAHFSYGAISLREVYQEVIKCKSKGRNKSQFISRLFWNQHFTQKLQDFPDVVDTPVNPALRDHNFENQDKDVIDAWKNGQTGYPLVDASMRALVKTGFINFRMRAMVASFFCHILHQWWKIGADFMHYHLIDADTAINYEQWQMQGGLFGIHPLRIYNPTKQIFDNDPKGEFIRKYVPELSFIDETKYLAEPHTFKEEIKANYGYDIEKVYPKPIADFLEESREAKRKFSEKKEEINKYVKTSSFNKKASLSKKRSNSRSKKKSPKKSSKEKSKKQSKLKDFL